MARDHDEVNEEKEKSQHDRTLKKFGHLEVDVRVAEMDALERAFKKSGKRAVQDKEVRNRLCKDFLEKVSGDQRPDSNLIDFLRKTHGGAGVGGVNNDEFEPGIPTGILEQSGDLPWDREDDD